VTFDGLLSWTYCYGLKAGQGFMQPQDNVTFKNSTVYQAAVGLGVHHKRGTATASNIPFENIDIEQLPYTNDSNRTWLALWLLDPAGSLNITGDTNHGPVTITP
jgi:hypothetical protein